MKARGKIMTAVCLGVSGFLFLLAVGRSGGATLDLPLAGKNNGGEYVVVDDFDSYQNMTELLNVWNDYWSNSSGAQIFLQKDPNFVFVRDGNSVWLSYDNSFKKAGKYIGSWMDANPAELEVGLDWTVSGANTLVIYFYGHAGNSTTINDRMWVELEDLSSNVGLVLYDGDADDLKEEWWHEWDIDLGLFDACGVDLAEVGSVAIGFGGYERTGQTADGGTGYVWFDDIRLCGIGDAIPGLIAHWQFDEGTGVTAYDSVGSSHGTLNNGPIWASGQIGGALEFDGVDDYVDLGFGAELDFERTDTFTVSAWYRGIGPSDTVWSKMDRAISYRGYDMYIKDGYVVAHLVSNWSSNAIRVDGTLYPVIDLAWHHIVVTYDGSSSANGLKIYVDAMEELTSVYRDSLSSTIRNSASFKVGARSDGGGTTQHLNGTIDDVRIYDRALSAGEIQGLYEDGLGDMVAHWTFDEGTGGTAYDWVGDNDGTIYGATWTTGKIGEALSFDGVNDLVVIADDDSLTPPDGLTISAWIYINAVSWIDRTAIMCKYAYWSPDRAYTLELGKGSNPDKSSVCLTVSETTNPFTGKITCGTTQLQAGQWYHVVGTFEPDHQEIYINRVEETDDVDPQIADSIANNSEPLYIGYNKTEDDYFNGIIDDVRIYDRALSAAEVQALYQGGLVNTAPIACIEGGDRVVEVGEDCQVRVVLDGSCSSDEDSTEGTNDDIDDFDWYEVIDACEPNSDIYIGSGEVIECNLGLGEHLIVLEVTDKAGAFDSNEVVIAVEDVTPPELSLVVEPNVLWPPNGKMVQVRPEWEVSDNCDEEVEVSLVDISMSAAGDINDYVHIGDDGSIYLRARRSKGKDIRVYTLTYEAVDYSGNVTEESATVAVRHRKGPKKVRGKSLSGLRRRLQRRLPRGGR